VLHPLVMRNFDRTSLCRHVTIGETVSLQVKWLKLPLL